MKLMYLQPALVVLKGLWLFFASSLLKILLLRLQARLMEVSFSGDHRLHLMGPGLHLWYELVRVVGLDGDHLLQMD